MFRQKLLPLISVDIMDNFFTVTFRSCNSLFIISIELYEDSNIRNSFFLITFRSFVVLSITTLSCAHPNTFTMDNIIEQKHNLYMILIYKKKSTKIYNIIEYRVYMHVIKNVQSDWHLSSYSFVVPVSIFFDKKKSSNDTW